MAIRDKEQVIIINNYERKNHAMMSIADEIKQKYPVLKKVNDLDLEKDIQTIINRLFEPNASQPISFAFYEPLVPLARIFITPDEHLITISYNEVQDLFKNEDGKAIIYATLAHEIGHLVDTRKNVHNYEDTLEYELRAEVNADKIALALMEGLYDNPKEILHKQMVRALDKNLNITESQENIDLGVAIYKARRKALFKN